MLCIRIIIRMEIENYSLKYHTIFIYQCCSRRQN